jgi:hypothetical protein
MSWSRTGRAPKTPRAPAEIDGRTPMRSKEEFAGRVACTGQTFSWCGALSRYPLLRVARGGCDGAKGWSPLAWFRIGPFWGTLGGGLRSGLRGRGAKPVTVSAPRGPRSWPRHSVWHRLTSIFTSFARKSVVATYDGHGTPQKGAALAGGKGRGGTAGHAGACPALTLLGTPSPRAWFFSQERGADPSGRIATWARRRVPRRGRRTKNFGVFP